MAGEFGAYTPTKLSGFMQQSQQDNATKYDDFFRPGSAISKMEKYGIMGRRIAEAKREAAEKTAQENSLASRLNKASEESTEGDVVFGKLGSNPPRDTRMAETLAALGIDTDMMRAIVASAQLHPNTNRR